MDEEWLKQVARLGFFVRGLPVKHAERVGDGLVVAGLCLQDYFDCTNLPRKWHRALTASCAMIVVAREAGLLPDRRN